jgi:zinc transport system substrate-binding protein
MLYHNKIQLSRIERTDRPGSRVMRTAFFIVGFCLVAAAGLAPAARAATAVPQVVVSLKPVHSLVAGVMAGVGEPKLLIPGSASPHSYSLKPSDARALSQADLVFWIGNGMETFLEKPLNSLANRARVVELSTVEGVTLLKTRASGAWEPHGEHEADEEGTAHPEHDEHGEQGVAEEEHAHHHGAYNLHIWLDPDNAIAIVEAAVTALSDVDPGHAADYARNGAALIGRLQALDRDLWADLAPVRTTPFVVFHDAYQYFEKHYDLNAVGSITLSPDRTPGASRLSEIRNKIKGLSASCVFSEPQFAPSVVHTVIEGTSARQGVLDPLGADLPAGPEAYFALMRDLVASLRKCLALAS